MIITTEISKVAGVTTKDGSYYELQEISQRNKETEEVVPHYDGEISWFRVQKTDSVGMPAGVKDFGPDLNKAYKWLKNRR